MSVGQGVMIGIRSSALLALAPAQGVRVRLALVCMAYSIALAAHGRVGLSDSACLAVAANRPLVRELVVSTPEIAAQLGTIPSIHPGARYLVGQVEQALDHGAGPQNVTDKWSNDPEKWSELDWFHFDGSPVDRTKAKLVTWGRRAFRK